MAVPSTAPVKPGDHHFPSKLEIPTGDTEKGKIYKHAIIYTVT